jgi:NAD(P)-dependent dehydrogenase (short-subunit alcohol dehydrogenase family)
VDITHQASVKEIVSLISIKRGIGILINNAGIAHIGNLTHTTEEDFQRIFNVNVKGAFHCMQAIIPFMEEMKEGLIINMASIAATIGITDRFAYSMSKGAILSMTLSVARDYIKKGIRCNCISPARGKKKKCLINFLQVSPSEEWQHRKKLHNLHFTCAANKLHLSQAQIFLSMEDLHD